MKHFSICISFLFFYAFHLAASTTDHLPNQLVDYKFENEELEEILLQISQEQNVGFGYRNSLFNTQMIYTGEYKNLPLSEMLFNLLTEFDLCYTWMNNQFIIHTDCGSDPIIIRGTIVTQDSLKVIPYVSVASIGSSKGVIADGKGYFEWELQEGADSLLFISLGYENLRLPVDSLRNLEQAQIKLKQKIYELPLVEVRRKEYIRRNAGNSWSEMQGSLYIDTQGQQTGMRIRNKKKRAGRLRSISYYLSEDGNIDAPFRIRIYSVSEDKPNESLLKQPVIVKPDIDKSGWFKVDMRQFYLDFPHDGLIIAMEGIYPREYAYYNEISAENSEEENVTPNTLAYGQQLGYNHNYSDFTWHLSAQKKWFQLENQVRGVMIYAIIDYEKKSRRKKE